MFYVAYRTLLVMFCVLKFYFVDFYGMFTSSPTWCLKMHVALQSWEKYYFSKQNITSNVLHYRHNKTFWYQFCNCKHFLKAENSEDSLASSCVELSIGLSSNPVWDWDTELLLELHVNPWLWVTVGTTYEYDVDTFMTWLSLPSLWHYVWTDTYYKKTYSTLDLPLPLKH